MRNMLKRSLLIRLFLLNFVILILPLFCWFGYLFKSTYSQQCTEALYMQNLADSRSNQLIETVNTYSNLLNILVDDFDLANMATAQQSTLKNQLERLAYFVPSLEHIFVMRKNDKGDFFIFASASTDFSVLENKVINSSFIITPSLKTGISMNLGFGPNQQPYAFITKIIRDKEDAIVGAITLAYDPKSLLEQTLDVEYNALNLHFALFADIGISFADEGPEFVMHSFYPVSQTQLDQITLYGTINKDKIIYFPVTHIDMPPFQGVFKAAWKGDKRFGLSWHIPNSNSMLVLAISENALFTKFYAHLWKSLIFVSFATMLASLFTWFLAKRLAQPLYQFMDVIGQISSKNLQVRYKPDEVGYEINELGQAVNHMLDNLVKQLETIHNEPIKQQLAKEELKIGHRIQQQILPSQLPVLAHFSLAATAKSSLEVGGDFYDIFPFNKDEKEQLFITIADGAGKGISACLFSLGLRSMLRSCIVSTQGIESALEKANELFCQDTMASSMFVTVFAGLLDTATYQFTYFSAGHLPALVKHKDGAIEKLWTEGKPLGIEPVKIVQKKALLQPGDIVLLYTDGVTEAMNHSKQLFGEERLMTFLKNSPYTNPQLTLDALLQDIEAFASGAAQSDDITAVVIYVA